MGLVYRSEAHDRAKAEWGTTSNPYAAGYILPDGSMLDMSEGQGERIHDHREVEQFFDEKHDERWRSMTEFMRQGAIRMMADRDGKLFLDYVRRPTDEQDSTIRHLTQYAEEVLVERTDPETGVVQIWNEWGVPGKARLHPTAVIRWMDETGMRGLGKVRAPARTEAIFYKVCKEAGKPFEYFEPGGSGFILPDGCFVQLDDHENIASYYPDDIMDKFGRAYEAVWDAVERGAVRVAWLHDENMMAFQVHKKPTPSQVRAIRELSQWSQTVYVDIQDENENIIDAQGWEILSKREPGQVVRFMREKGFGQSVAYPAGAPRGRLKFHWSPGAFHQALEVAESCSGPVKKVCQRQKHPTAGELVTCTWRDSSGRIVAGASGRKKEMQRLERDEPIGTTMSLWSDRDLLAGRCPR